MKPIAAILLSCCAAWACVAVDGEKILGKHLAEANPVFSTLDASLEIASAPLAGVQRVIHAEELARIARQNQLQIRALLGEACFERATHALTADELLQAMQSVLHIEDVHIELLDFSPTRVPSGTLKFLPNGPDPSGIWRGRAVYGTNHSAPVWAKVRITTEQSWVEAAEPLPAWKPIAASQLELRRGPRSPFAAQPLSAIELAAGRAPQRLIKPGEPIYASMLTAAREIERGDKVSVEVVSGAARLSFDAIAETSGRAGEPVLVRNPVNGRAFQARAASKGKVVVNK